MKSVGSMVDSRAGCAERMEEMVKREASTMQYCLAGIVFEADGFNHELHDVTSRLPRVNKRTYQFVTTLSGV
jgi:hypothetical protein